MDQVLGAVGGRLRPALPCERGCVGQGVLGALAAPRLIPSHDTPAPWVLYWTRWLSDSCNPSPQIWISPETGLGRELAALLSSVGSSSEVTMVLILTLFGVVHSGLAALRPQGELRPLAPMEVSGSRPGCGAGCVAGGSGWLTVESGAGVAGVVIRAHAGEGRGTGRALAAST